ncbi:hypothetical protein [Telmatospirillum sp.]|uniref:hypothetical protein n=1 Tax=Telmatospirillum sp. TaxID=2079197 RepID=UPI00284DCA63|nr:hypothetical protein [Telmatospirillum sp.]MDR3438150.1 hypothetical protein [Telmatospirillum sp.]
MTVQTTNIRTMLRWFAMLACAIWMGATFYLEFLDVDPDQFGFRSSDVESQMKSCGGSFQQRYDCKEAIIIAKGYDSFLIWTEKVCLILVPPVLVVYLLNRGRREKPRSGLRTRLARVPRSVARRRVR